MSFPFPFARALLGSLILATAPAVAVQADDGRLTLVEALSRVSADNPRLAAGERSVRAADALREQAGLRPLPMLDVSLENFGGTGPLGGFDSAEATVQASQVIERGGKRAGRVALADREHAAADAAWRADLLEARAVTAATFVKVLAATERLELARAQHRLAEEAVADAVARVRAGAASAADEARAKVALALTGSALARDEAALNAARTELAARWGGEPAEVAAVSGALSTPTDLPEPAALLERLAAHPRLAWRRAEIEGRRAGLKLEQARSFGDITVGAGVRFFRDGRDTALVAGFSVPLPVRGINQGNIRAARETLAGAERTAEADERDLRVAFGAAWGELTAARAAAVRLREEALPAAEQAHDLLRRAYERGEVALLEVLDVRRTLAGVRREIVDAEAAAATALVSVDALTDASFPLTQKLISAR